MKKTDPLQHEPFSFSETRAGLVQIAYLGKVVTTLARREASRFLARVETLDRNAAQLLMAKATGNFKRGNERATDFTENS
jgi:hypothetical protein